MTNEIQFLLYSTPEENVSVQAIIKDETLWLTQKSMAELFECTSDNISLHLKTGIMQKSKNIDMTVFSRNKSPKYV